MNPEFKTKWLAALESGEYTQGTGHLHHYQENTFCCLGVLCDIHPEVERYDERTMVGGFVVDGDIYRACLPPTIAQDVGIEGDHLAKLMTINDQSIDFGPAIKYIKEEL